MIPRLSASSSLSGKLQCSLSMFHFQGASHRSWPPHLLSHIRKKCFECHNVPIKYVRFIRFITEKVCQRRDEATGVYHLPVGCLCQQIWSLTGVPSLEDRCEAARFHRLWLCSSLISQPSPLWGSHLHHIYPRALWNYDLVFVPANE